MLIGESSESQQVAIIKVAGLGGGGQNAVEHMINEKINGVTFMCANTDLQALQKSSAHIKLQLGEEITKGLGAGANPEVGKQAAIENRAQIEQAISGADMIFITAGMGGGTGTGAAPVVAEIAREMGILTVAVVTKPFLFEGKKRMDYAAKGIEELRKHVDSLIIIPNNKLLSVLGKNVTLLSAFRAANAVLQGAVEGISNLVTKTGLINVDFADVRTVMSEMGMAMMGTGHAEGEDRARIAAESAVSSPLLDDVDLSGAKGILVNITAGSDMSIGEFEIVGDTIREFTSSEATVVVGTVIDPDMCDAMKVTIVVTGLGESAMGGGESGSSVFSASKNRRGSKSLLKADQRPRTLLGGGSGKQNAFTDRADVRAQDDKYLDIPAFLRQHELADD
ncbi:MAG: cell division protein FtsZ [Pseudomonadota bacterium]|nr:cell division protein FtsZ [Pseudomonadota bacterium]